MTTPITTTKSTFWTAFKNETDKVIQNVGTEAEVLVKDVENKAISIVEYTADKATLNIKNEVAKIQTLVNSKLTEIASKNTQVSSLQDAVVVLEGEVAKAKALAEKLVAAVS